MYPLIQEAFVPSALEPSVLCFWSLTQNTDEALLVDARGCAICHWGCGLGPTEAVSLPPLHSLWKLLSARNPCPGSAGDGDRKRQRHRKEREEHPRAISQIPTRPLHLGSHITGGPFRMQHFLWRNTNLAQSLRRFGPAFNILPNFSAFSTMQFVVVAVSFSKGWSFFPSYKKKPFSFVHLARDTWEEIEGFSNNFAFLHLSKPRPG